jgi:TetR/AcrR family transcriptional repressor of nem operon
MDEAQHAGKKAKSRARILASAGRGFREQGFGGLGVDGLAKAAGVTSGAFYAHFKSKAEAFREAVRAGMADLAEGVTAVKTAGGDWKSRFVDFYLGERFEAALAESCALQSLTGEVARADKDTRLIYEAELERVIEAMSDGATSEDETGRRERAIALLAMLSGGVSMARAVSDPKLAAEIVGALKRAAIRLN